MTTAVRDTTGYQLMTFIDIRKVDGSDLNERRRRQIVLSEALFMQRLSHCAVSTTERKYSKSVIAPLGAVRSIFLSPRIS